jgi:hypothetical protein
MAPIPAGQKILTSAPEVNTTYGGPESLKNLNTWYTLDELRGYKSYTALLTQSGEGEPTSISSGELVIGRTYTISSGAIRPHTWDFTNVGAPNNEEETSFVATGTVPNSWGNGVLNYNTGAPVVTVLENTIGNIWFLFDGEGYSIIESDNLFEEDKTWMVINGNQDGVDDFRYVMFDAFNTEQIYINTFRVNSSGVKTYYSNMLENTPIEIRVYN